MLFRKKKLTILLSSTVRLSKLPISKLIASTTVEVLESIPFSSGTSGGRGEGGGGGGGGGGMKDTLCRKLTSPIYWFLGRGGILPVSMYIHTLCTMGDPLAQKMF